MAERRFTVRLDAEMNISQVKSAVQTMQTELSKLNLPQDIGNKLTGTFGKLTGEIERFQAMSAKGIGSSKDFGQLERSGDKILQLYEQLRNQINGLGGLSDSQLSKMIPPSALTNIKKATDAFKTYKAEIERSQSAIQKQEGAISGLEGEISGLEKEISRVRGMKIVGSTSELNKMGKEVATARSELDGLEQEAQQVRDKMAQMESTMASPRKSSKYRDLQAQLEGLGPKIEQARNNYQNLQTQFANTTTVQKQITMLKTLGTDLENARNRLSTMAQELANMQANDGSTALQNLVNVLNQIPGINLDPTTTSLEQVQRVIANLSQNEINQLKDSFVQAGIQVNNTKGQFDQFGKEIDMTRGKVNQLDSQMGEVEMLKSRISYFFGLTNSVYLLRRALSSAMETVKELDKTMTEAAVVTDFSVDDMWDKLPQYTKEASRLGTTINDLYGATTLYYQQGLKTNEAMQLGAETMKMARIAGMEATEATEAMTAALRGFNMELTEASATRVNDVYSQLAAITAADTEQIATAMTKTASIAHNANMEFETTAALLAQIIETTQEAPETAGTAMKTIIARFSEVKELKNQGRNKGEDKEGEEIDVNKIQTALRTVGISMDEYFAGTEGLDKVLLRLAEKWDTLDFETQRYIATMAAGSRQQSRFIAMMSDYERTMELVGEANNSAGASQKQFEKTLDSIESKLNQLKNEWDRFAMGLADNELLKMGVDLLTGVLKVINNVTEGISGENGLLKSVISLGAAFGAIKLGGTLLTKGLGAILGIDFGKSKENPGKEAGEELKKGAREASQIETKGAVEEGAQESVDATEEGLIEKKDATEEGIIEKKDAVEEGLIEKKDAVEQGAIKKDMGFWSKTGGGIKNFFSKHGKTLSIIGGVLIASALVGAIANAFKTNIDNIETTEKRLNALKETEESLVGSTKELSSEISNLGTKRDNLSKTVKSLKDLKKGTVEWASALNNVREQMVDILENFPELREYTQIVNGVTVLTNEGWAKYTEMLQNVYNQQMKMLYITKMNRIETEKLQAAEGLNLQTSSITAAEADKVKSAGTTGTYIGAIGLGVVGYLAGTAIGAKIGTALGTAIAPGIGTAIGAVLGAGLGLLIGKVVGGAGSIDEGVAPELVNKIGNKAYEYGETGFSAQAALQQDNSNDLIKDFLKDSGLQEGTEDFERMFTYISENAEEFDRHSSYLMEANQQLLNFAYNLGQIRAQELGLEGDAAEKYAAIAEIMIGGHFETIKKNIYRKLLSDAEKKTFSNEKLDLSEVSGALVTEFLKYNKDNTYKKEDNTIVFSDTGNPITEAGFYDFIASGRATAELQKETDKIFSLTKGSSDLFDWILRDGKLQYEEALNNLTGTSALDLIKEGAYYLQGIKATQNKYGGAAFAGNDEEIGDAISMDTLAWQTYIDLWDKGTSAHEYYFDQNYDESWTRGLPKSDDREVSGRDMKRVTEDSNGLTTGVGPSGYASPEKWAEANSGYDTDYFILWYDHYNVENTYSHTDATGETVQKNLAQTMPEWYNEDAFNPGMLYSLVVGGYGDQMLAGINQLIEAENQRRKYTQTTYSEVGLNDWYQVTESGTYEGYGLTFLKDVSFGQLENFIDQFSKIAGTYQEINDDTLADWLKEFYNSLNGLSEDIKTEAMNIFTQINFKDLDSLMIARTKLNELSVSQEALEYMDKLTLDLKELGIAMAGIDLETLIKQVEELNKVVDKINDLEIGANLTFSEEEYQALISAGAARAADFVKTMDGFEYLGGSMEALRDTILNTNLILLDMQVDALRKKVGYADAVEKSGLNNLTWGSVSTWDADRMYTFATEAQKNIGIEFKNGKAYYNDQEYDYANNSAHASFIEELLRGTILEGLDYKTVEAMSTKSGLFGGWNALSDSTQTGIKEFLSKVADGVLNKTSYQDQLDTGISGLKQQTLSNMTGQEMIDMIGQKDSHGNVYTETDIDTVLKARAQQEGTDMAGYELGEQIFEASGGYDIKDEEERNRVWKEAHRLGQALALDAAKNQKEYSSLIKIFNENSETMTEANRGTSDYRRGLSKIRKAMEDAFNIKLSEEFMLEHAKLLEKVLAGEEGAWKQWADLMIQETARGMNTTMKNAVTGATALAVNIDNIAKTINPTIGVSTTFDGAGIIKAQIGLQQLGGQVVATQEQMDSLAAIYDMFGATLEFESATGWMVNGTMIISDVAPEGATGGPYTVITKVTATNTGNGLDDYFPSSGKKTEWENPYDKYYNNVKKINAELRKREQLERQYQRLLDRNAATAAEIAENQHKQLVSLESEKKQREDLLGKREGQMGDIQSEYSDLKKYAWWDEDLRQVQIDWGKINKLDGSTNEELTSRIEEYISKLEEQQDLIEEEEDAIQEINDTVWEIYEQGKGEYFDLEDQIKEAIIADRQREIDKLSEINDSINVTNSKLLDSMQQQIDEYRQNRDNEKVEEELSDKQRRLAYLQQDTSGANAMEIMQLQKEIEEGQEDYTDTLIDQKISDLQKQNEEAAEQRERQITLMQAQLDQYSESAAIWNEVNQLMTEGLDPEKGLVRGKRLEELLKSEAGWEGMSKLSQMDWMNELNGNIAQALAWLETGAMQHLIGEGNEVTFTTADGIPITGTVNEDGNVVTEHGVFDGKGFSMDSQGNIVSSQTVKQFEQLEPQQTEKEIKVGGRINAAGAKIYDYAGDTSGEHQYFRNDPIYDVLEEKDGYLKTRWYKSRSNGVTGWFKKSDVTAYKTGGLADFTGPAWLDGTKSKPEYILNADQTKAFFTLVDVLSGLQANTSKSSEKTGDNTYDIDINVESIGSDYDVEQLATTVKRLINEDARYRNNNAINLTR